MMDGLLFGLGYSAYASDGGVLGEPNGTCARVSVCLGF